MFLFFIEDQSNASRQQLVRLLIKEDVKMLEALVHFSISHQQQLLFNELFSSMFCIESLFEVWSHDLLQVGMVKRPLLVVDSRLFEQSIPTELLPLQHPGIDRETSHCDGGLSIKGIW